jgi:AraC-like DNA-binding protein
MRPASAASARHATTAVAELLAAHVAARHDDDQAALQRLLALARSGTHRDFAPPSQAAMLLLLARLINPVENGETVLCALALARRCLLAGGAAATAPTLLASARLQWLLWLRTDPRFALALHRPALDESARASLLLDLHKDASALQAWGRAGDAAALAAARLWKSIVAAATRRDGRGLHAALERFAGHNGVACAASRLDAHHAVAGALVVLGQVADANAILGRALIETQGCCRDERLFRTRLVSIIAAAQGDTTLALEHYRAYVLETSQHMALLGPLLRTVGHLLTAWSRHVQDAAPSDRPAHLDLALALYAQEAAEPSLATVAALAGVSERMLRSAFRRHLQIGPKDFSLQMRLQAVRCYADAGLAARLPVADLASRFGFRHAGRFSAQFRRRFGHGPLSRGMASADGSATGQAMAPAEVSEDTGLRQGAGTRTAGARSRARWALVPRRALPPQPALRGWRANGASPPGRTRQGDELTRPACTARPDGAADVAEHACCPPDAVEGGSARLKTGPAMPS